MYSKPVINKKLWILIWKNLMLFKRQPVQSVMQIGSPVFFSLILIVLRGMIGMNYHPEGRFYSSFPNILDLEDKNLILVYSPSNFLLSKIIKDVVDGLNMSFTPFKSSKEMITYLKEPGTSKIVFAAVQFDNELKDISSLPKTLNVTLRFPNSLRTSGTITEDIIWNTWQTDRLFPKDMYPGPRTQDYIFGGPPGYGPEGFLVLQERIGLSIIKHLKGNFQPPKIVMKRFPYPGWLDDPFIRTMGKIGALIFIFGFMYTFMNTVKFIVREKELELKNVMNLMGLPEWIYWFTWFISLLIFYTVSICLIVMLVMIPWYSDGRKVFAKTNFLLLFIFFFIFSCSTISFSFLVAKFFKTAHNASGAAGLIWILSFVPYLSIDTNSESYLLLKLFSCIFSNTAMGLGIGQIINFEGNEAGLQWNNIWNRSSPDENLLFGYVILMLVLDTVVYLFVATLLERYLLSKICRTKSKTSENVLNMGNDTINVNSNNIYINNLSKTYGKKEVLEDVSMEISENEITVILGHNGAGKTTLLSILSGTKRATSGSVIIKGENILDKRKRDSFGYCPQFDILIKEMTVYENLKLFCVIKGMNDSKEIEKEIELYITMLDLNSKKDALASTLSGGLKRKLCVGIALCANSKFVIFDEPSAGMDPKAKRFLWDLLQTQKKGRTMILTTHSMDEADVVGDKIAVMMDGNLKCFDTSFALKKTYGSGYYLNVQFLPNSNKEATTLGLEHIVPGLKIETAHIFEIKYLIEETQKLPEVLKYLEKNSEILGIKDYGVSFTTLGDVLTRVLDVPENEDNQSSFIKQGVRISTSFQEISEEGKKRSTGLNLYLSQFLAIFIKRIIYFYHTLFIFGIQIFIAISLTVIAIYIGRRDSGIVQPNLLLSPEVYYKPIITVNKSNNEHYYSSFKELVKNKSITLIDFGEKDFETEMFEMTKKNMETVRNRVVFGATFTDNVITSWFNNIGLHSAPISLSMVINSILRSQVSPNHLINFKNHPVDFGLNFQLRLALSTKSVGHQLAFFYGFAMALITAFFIIIYVYERQNNFKHLQKVSGVQPSMYWFASVLWDLIIFSFIICVVLITLCCFQEDGLTDYEDLSRVSLILFVFVLPALSLNYILSFIFNSSASAFVWMVVLNILTGATFFVVVQVLQDELINLKYISDDLHKIFIFLPHYALIVLLVNRNFVYSINSVCKKMRQICGTIDSQYCSQLICNQATQCCREYNYWGWEEPGLGKIVFYLLISTLILIVIVQMLEHEIISLVVNYCLHYKHKKANIENNLEYEDDVVQENEKVDSIVKKHELQMYQVVLQNISKSYKTKIAVKRVSLAIETGECFGLLGQNGAGKTTLFKIMTGNISFSDGNLWIEGTSLKNKIKTLHKNLGYCPQFNAILEEFTGKEILLVFCLLKGIKIKHVEPMIRNLADLFNFYEYLNVKTKNYSGGNKRKLSTAIAFIGNPSLVYLDEPSSAMDPISQKQMWKVLNIFRKNGTSMILASHSMDECEALCTRVGVLIKGHFQCMGSVHRLKQKFMGGYVLNLKIHENLLDKVKEFVSQNFSSAVLKEEYTGFLQYHIKNLTTPLSDIFTTLEKEKSDKRNIEDYSLGQAGLEQVFLMFAEDSNEHE